MFLDFEFHQALPSKTIQNINATVEEEYLCLKIMVLIVLQTFSKSSWQLTSALHFSEFAFDNFSDMFFHSSMVYKQNKHVQ